MAKSAGPISYLAVGQIVGPHGIRGEVKVAPMTDFPERFKPGSRVFLGAQTGQTSATPAVIGSARPHQGRWLVQFTHITDRNGAETLRDQYVLIAEADAMPLGDHENYVHDLIDLEVKTADGEPLGRLVEVLFTAANDVYVVRGEQGETLIPATRDVVLSVDLAARQMVVALPEGLLQLSESSDEEPDDE